MSETPFLAELRLMSFSFPPKGWAQCNGQLLPINQNQALFSLMGTMYGGNGTTNFALPDLRGRVPTHRGGSLQQGSQLGAEAHTLTQSEIPAHSHQVNASSANGNTSLPSPAILAATENLYRVPTDLTTINAALQPAGGGQAHENRHPLLTLNWCVALQGIFPSRN